MVDRDKFGRFIKGHNIESGFRKGATHSEESKKKISDKLSGFVQSESHIKKRVSTRRLRDNYKHTEETKRKIAKILKGRRCNPTGEFKKGNKSALDYRHSKESRKQMSIRNTGDKNPNWRGGITCFKHQLMNRSKWKIWRELVFARDSFTCQNNNCSYCNNIIGIRLHAHHIKPMAIYPELVFNVSNGIAYCEQFHYKGGLHIGIKQQLRNDYTNEIGF